MPISLQTLMPATVTPNSQTIVTDIDGDGVNEVIIFDDDLLQLSVVHQFHYNDFTLNGISPTVWPASNPGTTTPIWSDTNAHWMTIWASQQASVPGGWTIQPGDAIMAADLDGDGIAEFFLYNQASLEWGVLKWQSNTNQLQLICKVSVAPQNPQPSVPPGSLSWVGSFADRFFVLPNVSSIVPGAPANAAGILLYNFLTLEMGMIWFSASQNKFMQPWSHSGSSLNNWNLGASTPSANQFYPGNFANVGTPSVVAYDNSDAYMALLQWDGQNFGSPVGAQGHNVGGWNFGSQDQLQVADLDGDGMSEILIYAPNDQYLGILKWNTANNNMESLAVTNGQIGSSPDQWSIGANDKYYCVNNGTGNAAQIFAFSPDSLQAAVLAYQSGKFVCQWSGSSLLPNNGWTLNAQDTYFARYLSSSATPPLFAMSSQGSAGSPVLTLGAVSLSATSAQIASSALVPVLAWSPAFVAGAPHTDFTPFTQGDQPAIYTYISNLFPVPGQPSPGAPVRTLYTNEDYEGKFVGYAEALAAVGSPGQIPSTWPAGNSNWSTSDWQAVVNTIVRECNQVDTVYSLYNALGTLSAALNAFQQGDLKTVTVNMQQLLQTTPSQFNYWLGQIFVMCMAGLAAGLTGGVGLLAAAGAAAGAGAGAAGVGAGKLFVAGFGVFMSMTSSIVNTAVQYNPTQQKSFAVDDVDQQITNTLAGSFVTQSLDLTAYLSDPVKLNICNGLSSGAWEIPTSLPSSLDGYFQEMDRLWMYQVLIPSYFSLVMTVPGQFPLDPLYVWNNTAFYFNAAISAEQFQTSALYQDLFTTLGVSQEDFFVGFGAWAAIPRKFVPPA